MRKKHGIAICLWMMVGAFAPAISGAGESVVYDSTGQVRRVHDINYVPPVTLGGVVPKAIQSRQPLQLINPFAGREYGYGRGMVSWDKLAGKPKGFILFSAKVW